MKHKSFEYINKLVEEKTKELQETNIALKVLLNRQSSNSTVSNIDSRIYSKVENDILPYLVELEDSDLTAKQKENVRKVYRGLEKILSLSNYKLMHEYNITETEMQVVELIMQNKKTREIAEELSVTEKTVNSHRYRIRKKLKIGSDISLREIKPEFPVIQFPG